MGEGWPYSNIISLLFANNLQLDLVGKTFYDYYNQKSGDWRTATVSLTKTKALDELANIVREILADKKGSDIFAIDRSNMQRLEFLPSTTGLLYDFQYFIHQLATEEQYNRFSQALDNVIIYEAHTPKAYFAYLNYSYPINQCSGLNVYIPKEHLETLHDWYKNRVDWYKAVYPQQ
jgi:hypothetical protein